MIDRTRLITAFAAVLLIGALLPSGAAGVAVAQDNSTNESDPLDGFLAGEETNDTDDEGLIDLSPVKERLSVISASVKGQLSRTTSKVRSVFGDDTTANADRAVAFKSAVNDNASTYKQAVNARDNVEITTGYDVHEVIIAHEDSDPAAVYVLGDLNESTEPNTLTSLRALNESEFNETNRSIDETWVLEDQAATDADQLVGDIAERIENDEALDKSYQARLLGQYCGAKSLAQADRCDIRSTIWLDQSKEDLRNATQE